MVRDCRTSPWWWVRVWPAHSPGISGACLLGCVFRERLKVRECTFTLCQVLCIHVSPIFTTTERASHLPKMAKLGLKSRTGCYQRQWSFFSGNSLVLGEREGETDLNFIRVDISSGGPSGRMHVLAAFGVWGQMTVRRESRWWNACHIVGGHQIFL